MRGIAGGDSGGRGTLCISWQTMRRPTKRTMSMTLNGLSCLSHLRLCRVLRMIKWLFALKRPIQKRLSVCGQRMREADADRCRPRRRVVRCGTDCAAGVSRRHDAQERWRCLATWIKRALRSVRLCVETQGMGSRPTGSFGLILQRLSPSPRLWWCCLLGETAARVPHPHRTRTRGPLFRRISAAL